MILYIIAKDIILVKYYFTLSLQDGLLLGLVV